MVSAKAADQGARRALAVWGLFITVAVALNGTIPFALGADVRTWTFSPVKAVLFYLVCYAVIFMSVPLVLIKRRSVLKSTFLVPLLASAIGIAVRHISWPNAHEMSNPEYWYSGLQFGFVFVGVVVWAAFCVWRRSFPVIWVGDGLSRFLTSFV